MKMPKKILDYLTSKNKTISFAESVTGGGLVYEFVKNQGASKVLKESFVVYSNEAKISTLGVSENTILEHSVVSEEVAREMAKGLKNATKCDLAVAITGNSSQNTPESKDKLVSFLGIVLGENEMVFRLDYKAKKREKVLKKLIKTVYEIIADILEIK